MGRSLPVTVGLTVVWPTTAYAAAPVPAVNAAAAAAATAHVVRMASLLSGRLAARASYLHCRWGRGRETMGPGS